MVNNDMIVEEMFQTNTIKWGKESCSDLLNTSVSPVLEFLLEFFSVIGIHLPLPIE